MIDERILELKPIEIFCPMCGKWHEWEGVELDYHDRYDKYEYVCYDNNTSVTICFEGKKIYVKCIDICNRANTLTYGYTNYKEIEYDYEECSIKFEIPIPIDKEIETEKCVNCRFYNECYLPTIWDNGNYEIIDNNNYHLMLEFKIKFKEEEFYRYASPKQRQEEEIREAAKKEENKEQEEKKEDATMKTTIFEQLYEHSPKENVELVKHFAEKYKGTLKWAVPVVSIYGAYRILNKKDSQLTIDNVSGKCQEALGFTFDNLKDKKLLAELMALGGLSAGAYAAIKAISTVQADKSEISMDEIEDGLEKVDGVSKKFAWIQPKTEKLLPVAVSVITVYLMTQEPAWFVKVKDKVGQYAGNISVKTGVYVEMLKLFAADKLHVDLEDSEEVRKFKKFALLAAIVGIAVFLYGKDILKKKADSESKKNEKMAAFIEQVASIMQKIMPSAFAGISTYLISKKVIEANEQEDDLEEVVDYEEDSE